MRGLAVTTRIVGFVFVAKKKNKPKTNPGVGNCCANGTESAPVVFLSAGAIRHPAASEG